MADSMDCTFLTEQGKFNFRVGVIISNGTSMLMARNPILPGASYYSVGGRVRFGESLAEAALREVKEETGLDCEIDRIAAFHENFFTNELGIPYHEISVFFTLKPDERLLTIESGHMTDGGPQGEYLEWVDMKNCEGKIIYPDFFKTVDFSKEREILHFITRN
ncbi:MAG: NUDIX domain-containing protein [Oscillospiraceae bacterium]|nr:NUDIX domain-containing protein [Oscillospiraceae bacterium]